MLKVTVGRAPRLVRVAHALTAMRITVSYKSSHRMWR